ncbi:cell wall hydrolase [Devosia sp.]|uniref:cell wall hydrolase n=1 Tax=Devosia sp. TaxID=1871048 RepID=UPI003BAAF128
MRVFTHVLAIAAAAFVLFVTLAPASAEDLGNDLVVPLPLTDSVSVKREEFVSSTQPQLTSALLAAYVERKQELATFNGFDVPAPQAELTEAVLLGYIAKQQNQALDAIESVDLTDKPALTADVLTGYAEKQFVPTFKRVKLADSERLCLAQAIYHEARGESQEGQLAVANVIINRAMSKKYPTTICGVVFQNADKGHNKCQFTFACDGRSDMGTERTAWNRSLKLADLAFHEFQQGDRPGVIPNSALFYHTTSVAPSWSNTFKRVASIGSHIFYAAR